MDIFVTVFKDLFDALLADENHIHTTEFRTFVDGINNKSLP
jgi:hypothetical protein